MNEPRVIWDKDGWAAHDGWAFAHRVDVKTGELTTSDDIWVSMGCGLPAGVYLDEPPAKEDGKAIIRSNSDWTLVDDLRGQTAYNTATGQPIEITDIGPLTEGLTLVAPSSQFDRWNGSAWARDEQEEAAAKLTAAEHEQQQRIIVASQQIAILTPAVDGGYAKPAHTQLLADWQRYRYELTQVPEQTGWPETPQWPTEPDKVI
ncbi:TPA: tail fiber assembly protein [Aeromonas veronii]